MKWIRIAVLFMLFMSPVLTACSSVQATSAPTETVAPTATSAPPTETPIPPTDTPEPTATAIPPTEVPVYREKIDVGGYTLYIKCIGEGSPTVVMISQHGVDNKEWTKVIDNIDTDLGIRICAYDRAGLGYSEQSPTKPRTTQDMTEELHILLTNASISGPYIMAGDRLGASIARIYTHLYPADIAGIVMVGPSFEVFTKQLLTVNLPEKTEDENPSITKIRDFFTPYMGDPMKLAEFWDIPTSMEQMEAAGDLGDLPLMIVANDIDNPQVVIDQWRYYYGADTPQDLLEEIEADRAQNFYDLAALSTDSVLIVVPGCDMNITGNASEQIAEAIENMVEKVRSE